MRSSCRLSVRGPLMVAAAGLVLSIAFSRMYSSGYEPVAGALCGAFLGLVNFASLYRFGITVLSSARTSPRDAGQTDRSGHDRTGAFSRGDTGTPSYDATDTSIRDQTGMISYDQTSASDHDQPAFSHCSLSLSPGRAGMAALCSFSLRFPMMALGLAAVARHLGVGALAACAVMLFAVQVPLFVSLGRVVYREVYDDAQGSVLLGR